MIKYLFLIIGFLLSICGIAGAQNYSMSIASVKAHEKLNGNRVVSLMKDSDGFIWMLTDRGVARYDGHDYIWFDKINSQLRDIPRGSPLVEDSEGYIWMNQNGRIDLIHKSTFEVIYFEEKFKDVITENYKCVGISSIPNGRVYIDLKGETKKNALKLIYTPNVGFEKHPLLKNYSLKAKKNDFLWLQDTGSGIWYQYNLKTKKIIASIDLNNIYRKIKWVETEDKDRFLFYGSKNGNFVLFEVKGTEIHELYSLPILDPKKYQQGPVTHYYYYAAKKLFVSLTYGQLDIVDLEKQKIIPVRDIYSDNNLRLKKVLLTDKQGNLWIRAADLSLKVIQLNPSLFKTHFLGKPIRGTWKNDNFIYTAGVIKPLQQNKAPKDLALGICVAINDKENLWIGNIRGVFNLYAKNDELQSPIRFSKASTGSSNLWSILKDKNGTWWAGGTNGFWNNSTYPDTLTSFNQHNEFIDLKKATTVQLVEEGEHIFLVSSTGLYLLNKQKGIIRRYNSTSSDATFLPFDNIHFLHKDGQNVYWAATKANGLIRFTLDDNWNVVSYKQYTMEDGLPSNILYAILEDDVEDLWISTYYGLACLNTKTETFQVFNKKDGLPIDEFNRISYFKDDNGIMYFGTIKGLIEFDPKKIKKDNNIDNSIIITRFEKYQKEGKNLVNLTDEIKTSKKIVLKPSDRFFRLNISMLDYFGAERVKYSYKIKGVFEDFQLIKENVIEIGGLPYGKFQLIIKAQGADGRMSSENLVIDLVVKKPFYLQWWFLLLGLVAIGITLAQIYTWRVRNLEARKNELELLVKQRTSQINQQAVELKELNEAKSKFFANISHELRTPLTLILGPLNNVLQRNQLSNKDFTYLMMMRQNGNKLLKRINELLDLSRLESSKLKVEEKPVSLYPFLKVLISSFESTATIKDIQLLMEYDLDENMRVLIDDDKVEKIVINYLSNAIKFTPKDGKILLKVSKVQQQLQISVSDTGIGIPSNELDKVFGRFYQTSASDYSMGTGIGLSLSKEFAKLLKGRVWATSEIGKGSTFYVTLPLVETFSIPEKIAPENVIPASLSSEETKQHKVSEQFRPNVLVVEDNPDLRSFLTMILGNDYNVTTAENGADAFEQLDKIKEAIKMGDSSNIPHLIISDVMMPIMDGIEFLTKIKKSNQWQHLPVIMLTARQNIDVKINALRIGVDDYLTKPFREEELKARVANLIRNSQNRIEAPVAISNKIKSKSTPSKAISEVQLKWLEKIESIILKEISNTNFSLTDIAPQVEMSYSGLTKKLKRVTGLTPKQYERSIKLNKAREILKSGQVMTVSEVMHQLGFDHHYYFSKMYKEEFGIMPSEELA